MTFKSRPDRQRPIHSANAMNPDRDHGRGVPRFLTLGRTTLSARPARNQGPEQAAEHAAHATLARGTAPTSSPIAVPPPSQAAALRRVADRAGPGQPAPNGAGEAAAGPEARIHTDSRAAQLAGSLHANAVTLGRDIFFAPGRYAPGTPAGDRLLAHELTHVAQQQGEPRALQCDLMQSMPVTLGVFEIGMATQTAPPGLSGTITFLPDPNGPYSAEIGLVQAVNATDVAGTTTPASGAPVTGTTWSMPTPVSPAPKPGAWSR